MIAIMFGRAGSRGVPGKNTAPILGRPSCAYPLMAASASRTVRRIYVSTDDPAIADIAQTYGARIIRRPAYLCTDDALLEDAIAHAWAEVGEHGPVCILQANAPCITSGAIDGALHALAEREDLDSAITACELPGFAPHRARTLTEDARLVPVMPTPDGSTCDRRSSDAVYFHDGGATVVWGSTLARLRYQPAPYRWQGARIGMVEQPPGPGDIDHPWQIAAAEWWLSNHASVSDARAESVSA